MDDKDKFEEKELMRNRPFAKSIWYIWLINHIPKPIIKTGGVKDKILSPFKTNTTNE